MAILKCKMCGGDIELSADKSFGTCECCGSTMTFPKIDDEQKLARFNRGNAFRRAGEFDKALALYENIVRDDDNDSEAHWCCALCRFGIEYVEDPATFEYVPTCHRASFDSFLEDVDYLAAVEHADGVTKRQYQKEAVRIADIQKRILATSQNEEPFDVFICYKETDDATGQRTKDSIDAQEIYYQLTNDGYRVFFSRITLEDKVGAEYEPYIFAALNSAKVMVVIGSKTEYFNAVWVKNEWSRFLALMRKDRSKLLLPCYRDIDPYDLPEQLSVLQSYDMSKIGFIQDLIRGIKKIAANAEPKSAVKDVAVSNTSSNSNVAPLLERAFMFLEDGKWMEADEYCEKVLDAEPKNAKAYLGKLMAFLKVNTKENLKNVAQPFDNNNNCIKAMKFDSAVADELKFCNDFIRNRNEENRLSGIYLEAVSGMKKAVSENDFKDIASMFGEIIGYKDSKVKMSECLKKAEIERKNSVYFSANTLMKMNTTSDLRDAIDLFQSIIDWEDSRSKIDECTARIEDIRIAAEKAVEEQKRKEAEQRIVAEKAKAKKKKVYAYIAITLVFAIVLVFMVNTIIIPSKLYKEALSAIDSENYADAYLLFEKTNGYKDSNEKKLDILPEYLTDNLSSAEVGDTFILGSYEQDNKPSNGKEKIEWQVLFKGNGKVLVVSKYALDCRQFDSSHGKISWEESSLRTWLNNSFYNAIFTSEERNLVDKFISRTNDDSKTSTELITDKIFLLSRDELPNYLSTSVCIPTKYAISNGAYLNDSSSINKKEACWWWLRSSGSISSGVLCVNDEGVISDYGGYYADNDSICVRPAMWISIEQ